MTNTSATPRTLQIETLAVHTGSRVDPSTGAVIPPIHMTTTFERREDGSYTDGYVYGRSENPNRRALEEMLAMLEAAPDATHAVAFASGMGACAAVLGALQPGDHMVIPDDLYFGVRRLVTEHFSRWQIEATPANIADPAAIRAALRPTTRIIWAETPSNPQLKICDLAAAAEIAQAHGAFCVVDNTWATPMATQPLALGAHAVIHSTTKYLGGHSDVTGGVVVVREAGPLLDRIRLGQTVGGNVPSPFDCWLLLRSIRTLPWRMRAHTQNATALAHAIEGHPAVAHVHYPGLRSHAGFDVATRQMKLYGGMLSIEVRGGAEEAMEVTNRLRIFTRATSLGGVESLIEHRRSVEGPASTTPPALLRVSVGLENAADLIDDLTQALDALA
jgi:cystathionine gamma-synthase